MRPHEIGAESSDFSSTNDSTQFALEQILEQEISSAKTLG
jgi:hypothetical protein